MSELPPPPTDRHLDRLSSVLSPFARVTQPRLYGVDRIPERGVLFVGNHTIYGLIDLPFMTDELWRERGIRVRGLGEHGHYGIPVWRDLLEMSGMVRGTRENVRALMDQDQHILVYPGGAGEVMKQRGQKYQLIWKERLGFAKLALESGYPILPFAAVGAEEMLDVVVDNQTPGFAQASSLMKRLVGIPLPPIARGIGPTMIPRPERLYFQFGNPIETVGRDGDEAGARALRDEVRAAVESGIEDLKARRSADPRRGLMPRILGSKDEIETPSLARSDPEAWFVTHALDEWNELGPESAAAWMDPRVTLTDPPDWPDSSTWSGRAEVIGRLREVTTSLGADWVDLADVHSSGAGEVVASLDLRSGERRRVSIGQVRLEAKLKNDQILQMRAFM